MNTEERHKVLESHDQIEQLEKAVREQGQEWIAVADEWIQKNPYVALGIAFAAGCAVVALMRGRD